MSGQLLLEPRPRLVRIALTPLVDVVFILLLFFMLSSSFARWRVVSLTGVAAGVSERAPELLRLSVDGQLHHARGRVERGELSPQVLARWGVGGRDTVVLQADVDTDLQQMVDALESLQRQGVARVGLAVAADE